MWSPRLFGLTTPDAGCLPIARTGGAQRPIFESGHHRPASTHPSIARQSRQGWQSTGRADGSAILARIAPQVVFQVPLLGQAQSPVLLEMRPEIVPDLAKPQCKSGKDMGHRQNAQYRQFSHRGVGMTVQLQPRRTTPDFAPASDRAPRPVKTRNPSTAFRVGSAGRSDVPW